MNLSAYHEKYASRSEADIQTRADVKEAGLKEIFAKLNYQSTASPTKVGILGCGDKRFVAHHKRIFESLVGTLELTTFDITIDHLKGEDRVFEHDISKPLPESPFDVLYGDVVLKFLDKADQWKALENAHNALRESGIAIFIINPD